MFLFVERQCASPTLLHSNMNSPTAIVFQKSNIIFFCDVPSDNDEAIDIKWYVNGSIYDNSISNISIDQERRALIFNNVPSNLNNITIQCSAVYYKMYPYNSSEAVLLVQGE